MELIGLASLFLSYLILIAKVEAFCSADSNFTLISPQDIGPQLGAADYLKGNYRLPWPRDEAKPRDGGMVRPVRYCFVNEEARMNKPDEKPDSKAMWCRLQAALKRWATAFGTTTRRAAGHSLAWKEAGNGMKGDDFQPWYCYNNYQDENNPGTWNPAVDPDTLAISVSEELNAATPGYIPSWAKATPGRNNMVLQKRATVDIITHEIGHVLGMAHEAQRNDRDDFIKYRCEEVRGYKAAFNEATKNNEPGDIRKKLCEDYKFADKYKFDGNEFIKNDRMPKAPGFLDEPEGFDLDSVMLYASSAFAASPNRCKKDPQKCPLSKIEKDSDGTPTGGETHLLGTGKPSPGDAAFLKRYYPWEDFDGPHPPDYSPPPGPIPSDPDQPDRTIVEEPDTSPDDPDQQDPES